MASWLSLSLPNLFEKQDDDDEDDDENQVDEEDAHKDHSNQNPSSPSVNISAVISRQFRGVAAFLAPPPISPDSNEISGGVSAESPPPSPLLGIKNDLVEIGGSFKSKLSLISSVSEISRFANSLLQFGEDDEENDEVQNEGLGLSEEIVSFVEDISERPELWTDFPLSLGNGKLTRCLSCSLNMIGYIDILKLDCLICVLSVCVNNAFGNLVSKFNCL